MKFSIGLVFARCALFVLVIFQFHISSAGHYFDLSRYDNLVPHRCREFSPDYFSNYSQINFKTFGIEGSSKKGFDYEIDISRSEATKLWNTFKAERTFFPLHFEFQRLIFNWAYDSFEEYADKMDFDFENEGEVLEFLTIVKLKENFPEPEYFVTGGIVYHAYNHSMHIGELDVVVGKSDSCQVLLIGEAKLNPKKARYAQEQLRRFSNFILSIIH